MELLFDFDSILKGKYARTAAFAYSDVKITVAEKICCAFTPSHKHSNHEIIRSYTIIRIAQSHRNVYKIFLNKNGMTAVSHFLINPPLPPAIFSRTKGNMKEENVLVTPMRKTTEMLSGITEECFQLRNRIKDLTSVSLPEERIEGFLFQYFLRNQNSCLKLSNTIPFKMCYLQHSLVEFQGPNASISVPRLKILVIDNK